MHLPIPIPIGTKHIAAVQGAVWKFVSCGHCQQGYAYLLELEAVAEDHDLLFLDGEGSAERARAKAEDNFLQKSRNLVVPVPCPNCGFYQEEMARVLKDEASINAIQIAGVVIAVLSLVPLAFSIPYLWVLTLVLAVGGVGLLSYGYVIAFRFDPNAGDPEARKALARKQAVWGEPLAELLAKSPHAPAQGWRPRPGRKMGRKREEKREEKGSGCLTPFCLPQKSLCDIGRGHTWPSLQQRSQVSFSKATPARWKNFASTCSRTIRKHTTTRRSKGCMQIFRPNLIASKPHSPSSMASHHARAKKTTKSFR